MKNKGNIIVIAKSGEGRANIPIALHLLNLKRQGKLKKPEGFSNETIRKNTGKRGDNI